MKIPEILFSFRSQIIKTLEATGLKKMNIPHDFQCHESSKNVYFVVVRNVEGQIHPWHPVNSYYLEYLQMVSAEILGNVLSRFSYLSFRNHEMICIM